MIFPCAVIYVEGNHVTVYPFLVEAHNEDEAIGLATRIGVKMQPTNSHMTVRVGSTVPVTRGPLLSKGSE